MISLYARKIGTLVNLDAPGYQLCGIFNHGSLAVSTEGAIVYLSSLDIQGPFNLYVPGLAEIISNLADGQRIQYKDGYLIIEGADVHIFTQSAAPWPSIHLPATHIITQQHTQIITSIIDRTIQTSLTESQPFLSLADMWGYAVETTTTDSISKPLWFLTRELYTALQNGADCNAVQVSRRCLGLGEGLTPAGDDLIAGICAVFSIIKGRSDIQTEMRMKYCTQMTEEAKRLTNKVSAAFIYAACRGEINDPLNQIVSCLVNGVQVEDGQLDQLSRTGHTSGFDGLAGVLLAIKLIDYQPGCASAAGSNSESSIE